MNIPNAELDEWLLELKKYQRDPLKNLVDEYGVEVAIDKCLFANGPSNTIKFGGQGEKRTYKENFKIEVNKFICGHPDYQKDINELVQHGEVAKTALIGSISAAVGAKLGIVSTVLVPATTLMLFTIGKMGINAYCRNVNLEDL